jgi:histidine triad (HIT) family protein
MSNPNCIFCKIASKELSSTILYEDATCVAFQDTNPQAPVHALLIPRKHFASPGEAEEADEQVLGHLHRVAAQLASQLGLKQGHRVVMNTGAAAGQSVFHAHLHLLGGRDLAWPPG